MGSRVPSKLSGTPISFGPAPGISWTMPSASVWACASISMAFCTGALGTPAASSLSCQTARVCSARIGSIRAFSSARFAERFWLVSKRGSSGHSE